MQSKNNWLSFWYHLHWISSHWMKIYLCHSNTFGRKDGLKPWFSLSIWPFELAKRLNDCARLLEIIRKSHKTLKNDSQTNQASPANINRKISAYVDEIRYFYSHIWAPDGQIMTRFWRQIDSRTVSSDWELVGNHPKWLLKARLTNIYRFKAR